MMEITLQLSDEDIELLLSKFFPTELLGMASVEKKQVLAEEKMNELIGSVLANVELQRRSNESKKQVMEIFKQRSFVKKEGISRK